MLRIIKESLGVKLFVLLTAVVVMAVVPLTYSALHSLIDYGDQALELHSDHITSQTLSSLQRITREKAALHQKHFDQIASSAAMLGSQAAAIYNNLQLYAGNPLYHDHLLPSPLTGNFISDLAAPVTTIYWGGSQISPDIREELRAISHMAPLFERALKDNPEALASHTITASGIGKYCTTREKYKKASLKIPSPSVFDLRDGEPMTIFSHAEDRTGDVRWTDIYKDDVIEGFMLTASAPVYDNKDRFRGITGIDVPLSAVIDDILTTDSHQEDNRPLFSFLLGANSKIIAFPQKYYRLFGIEPDSSEYLYSSDRLNLFLDDSINANVRKLAGIVISSLEHQQKIMLDGENYYVVTSKMQKQGWIFGVVVRESEMLQTVNSGRRELGQSIRTMAVKSVIFSLVTLGIAIAIIFLLLTHLINPLRKLSQATEQVAAGNFEVQCPVTTKDEPGVLATSFNSMVMQLRAAQKQQQMYSNYLEKEVAKRNEQVNHQKLELEKTVIRLQDEIEQRQIVSEKLQEQGEELQKSLQEKEVLLREIHHRIKNNMLIIISMLALQRQDIEQEKQREIFREMENRIRSMALVHEKLYSSNSISQIDTGSYLHDIAKSLLSSMVIDGRITLDVQTEPIAIDIDHAVPIGLVTNEIITNSIRHAFPEGRKGTISLTVKRCANNQLLLTLADDGIGLPEDFDIMRSSTFGTGIIIAGLVKMQLKGELTMEREMGTKYSIRFLDPILHKRL